MLKEANEIKMQRFFREMYRAHDTIKLIKDRIDHLYQSASYISPIMSDLPKGQPNPKRFEETIIEMADLKSECERILRERARFDLFVCKQLTSNEENVLRLRCENDLSWKKIAGILFMGVTTVKKIFRQVEDKAAKYDFSVPKKSE